MVTRSSQETLMEKCCPQRKMFIKVKDEDDLVPEMGSNNET